MQGGILGGMGCLCLWDLTSPAMPSYVLISEGRPSACTFAACSGAGLLVVAGASISNNVEYGTMSNELCS